jgi:tetratricopeptide (TPR) repeat protein
MRTPGRPSSDSVTSLETSYFFRHAAVRDVVYSLHLPSARAALHCAAFDALEQEYAGRTDSVAPELAEHARLGREGLTGPAAEHLAEAEFRYLRESIKRLNARTQWDQVVPAAQRALATGLGTPLERCELQHTLTQALAWLGRRNELQQAASELHRMGKAAGVLKFEHGGLSSAAMNLINLGDHVQAEKLLAQALELADTRGTAGLQAKARMDCGMLCTARGEHEKQEALFLEALALLGDSDDPIRWPIRGNLANLYSGTGRIDLAIKVLCEIIDEFSAQPDADVVGLHILATAQVNLARQYLLQGDLERAEHQFLRAIKTSAQVGKGSTTAFALANLAEVHLRRGEFERAEDCINRAIEGAIEQGLPLYHAAYSCTLAQLQLLVGHEQRAQELVENARAEFVAVGGDAFLAEYCGIVRLRIAASQAVSMAVPGRATSRLKASPPAGAWLPVMRELAAQIEQSRDSRADRASTPLANAAREAGALVAEVESAINEKRPALMFRGHLPGEMLPSLRKALLQRMDAGEAAMLERLHPELWRSLGG